MVCELLVFILLSAFASYGQDLAPRDVHASAAELLARARALYVQLFAATLDGRDCEAAGRASNPQWLRFRYCRMPSARRRKAKCELLPYGEAIAFGPTGLLFGSIWNPEGRLRRFN